MSRSVEALFSGLLSGARARASREAAKTALPLEECLAALRDKARRTVAPCPSRPAT